MASGPDLKIGITPWDFGAPVSAERLCAQAERAEALGFHSLWLPENHFGGPASIPQPLLWHAAIAARTRRLRLGTTSYLLPIRHPVQAAEEVAVLDQLSGGRVILGVGRGFRGALFDAFGADPKKKRDDFEATLSAMRRAWAGESLVDGDAPDAQLAPRPLQEPHPPIWVAAFGPKALEQAGRLGLPYLASPIEPESALLANSAAHRDSLTRHGHDPESLDVPVMRTVFAHDDPAVVARVYEGLARSVRALRGAPSAALRGAGDADVDEVAIMGEPSRVADAIARLREKLGVSHLIARAQVPGAEEKEQLESLEWLAGLRA